MNLTADFCIRGQEEGWYCIEAGEEVLPFLFHDAVEAVAFLVSMPEHRGCEVATYDEAGDFLGAFFL
jgi:hypothetical protein